MSDAEDNYELVDLAFCFPYHAHAGNAHPILHLKLTIPTLYGQIRR